MCEVSFTQKMGQQTSILAYHCYFVLVNSFTYNKICRLEFSFNLFIYLRERALVRMSRGPREAVGEEEGQAGSLLSTEAEGLDLTTLRSLSELKSS